MPKQDSTTTIGEIVKMISELEAHFAYVTSPECPLAARGVEAKDVRFLAIGKTLIEIAARLRALEPCPGNRGREHDFEATGAGSECAYCPATRQKVCP